MKSIRNISVLGICTLAIVIFWMIPLVNKGKDQQYTRLYEDVDRQHSRDTSKLRLRQKGLPNNQKAVVYKHEKLAAKKPVYSAKAFSRAVQYLPNEEIELLVVEDSVNVKPDSVALAKAVEVAVEPKK